MRDVTAPANASGEHDIRAGEVVASSTEIVDAIRRIARDVQAPEHCMRDAIARLPAVEL